MLTTAERMEHMPFSGIRVVMEKATQMDARGEHVIHLELGRPDFDTPQVIKEAAYKSLEKGNVFYTSNYGSMELRTAVAEKLRVENNIHYDPSEILITVGVGEGTFNAFGAYLEEGDEVLIPDPVWLNYIHVPEYFGAKAVPYTLKQENDYQIDMEELESKITDRTKMVVIISPNNPTGGVLGRETLEKLADIAIRHDLYVISDEIYEKLIFDGEKHISIASLPGMKERTITLNGFSKAYAMTGSRIGYAAGPERLIAPIYCAHQYSAMCPCTYAQWGAVAALRGPQGHIADMVKELDRRRLMLLDRLAAMPGVSFVRPKGAFYIMVSIPGLGTPMQAAEFLLDAGLAIVPWDEEHLRISYANSYENLNIAMDRMEKALRGRF